MAAGSAAAAAPHVGGHPPSDKRQGNPAPLRTHHLRACLARCRMRCSVASVASIFFMESGDPFREAHAAHRTSRSARERE